MTKSEFLIILKKNLISLPEQDRRKTIQYYAEMIDDRIEEGFSEEDAVEQIGPVYELIAQIKSDYGETTSVNTSEPNRKQHKKSVNIGVMILLILGFPLWFSLLMAVFSVLLALCVSLWSCIIALWSVFVSFIACSVGGIILGVIFNMLMRFVSGTAMIGAGIILSGLTIFTFYACKAATKGAAYLTKETAVFIKNCFTKKEAIL